MVYTSHYWGFITIIFKMGGHYWGIMAIINAIIGVLSHEMIYVIGNPMKITMKSRFLSY